MSKKVIVGIFTFSLVVFQLWRRNVYKKHKKVKKIHILNKKSSINDLMVRTRECNEYVIRKDSINVIHCHAIPTFENYRFSIKYNYTAGYSNSICKFISPSITAVDDNILKRFYINKKIKLFVNKKVNTDNINYYKQSYDIIKSTIEGVDNNANYYIQYKKNHIVKISDKDHYDEFMYCIKEEQIYYSELWIVCLACMFLCSVIK